MLSLVQINVIAKITFGGDLHLRSDDEKRGYKGALFYAHPGDLVISKIRVAQGSLCVVPDELDHLAVSSEYPVYAVDHERISADFIRLVIRSSVFRQRISRLRSGNTTKARIRPAQFEALNIPLPELAEQDALVSAYSAALDHAARLEQEAQAIEDAGLLAFEAALGVAAPPPLPERPVFVARFRDIEQWSHEGTLRASLGNREVSTATYPVIQLREVASISYGLQKSPANRPALHARPYLRVANVQRGHLILDEIKTINVPDENLLALRLEAGDILFVEGNGSRKELGRVALWHGQLADCVHQNHIIKARPDQCRLLPDFAMAWFNIAAGRDHFFQSGKTTSGLGTINSSVIRSAPIPLPPISDQRRLMEVLANASQSAATKLTEAQTLRASAWTAFESALFTTNDSPESHAGGSTRP
ncbi:MAG: hypothetical protein KAX51_09565 [Chromatiaceae bacterium]|nr:hypothetical protein [Chromatiaceae bacterium]